MLNTMWWNGSPWTVTPYKIFLCRISCMAKLPWCRQGPRLSFANRGTAMPSSTMMVRCVPDQFMAFCGHKYYPNGWQSVGSHWITILHHETDPPAHYATWIFGRACRTTRRPPMVVFILERYLTKTPRMGTKRESWVIMTLLKKGTED